MISSISVIFHFGNTLNNQRPIHFGVWKVFSSSNPNQSKQNRTPSNPHSSERRWSGILKFHSVFFEDQTQQMAWKERHPKIFNAFAIPATLLGTNISPKNGILKMIFLFPRWDMLIPWRVYLKHHNNKKWLMKTLIILRHLWLDYPIGSDPASWDVGFVPKIRWENPQHGWWKSWKTLLKWMIWGENPVFSQTSMWHG